MQRLTITVPLSYNDGTPVESWTTKQIEANILDLFDGFSRVHVYGTWNEHDNKGNVCRTYRDMSYRYEILTDKHYDILRDYARELCKILLQECILITCEIVDSVDFVS